MIRASQAKPIVDESVWQRHYLHHKRERYNEKFVLYKEVFERYLEPGGTCFEIGFLPGYILTYLSKHFRYTVSGIDLTPFDETEVRERMVLDGANVGKLFRGDFLQFASDEEYDVVCSFGFLEHFSNPEVIIKRHISLLRPGGTLVISCPNFRGAQYLLHRYLDSENLANHNLEAMDLDRWTRTLHENGMRILFQDYQGTFGFWADSPSAPFLTR